MKIAVLTTGDPGSWRYENHIETWNYVREQGIEVDEYYGAWKNSGLDKYISNNVDCRWIEKPYYDPDLHPFMANRPWGGVFGKENHTLRKHIHKMYISPTFYNWFRYGHFQIMLHSRLTSNVVNEIGQDKFNEYDCIIRNRYDNWFREPKKISGPVLERTAGKAVSSDIIYVFTHNGIEWRPYDFDHNETVQEPRSFHIRDTIRLTGFLADQFIAYSPGLFNTDLVEELFSENQLLPCELGWGQILADWGHDHRRKLKYDDVEYKMYTDYILSIDTQYRVQRRMKCRHDTIKYAWFEEAFIRPLYKSGESA